MSCNDYLGQIRYGCNNQAGECIDCTTPIINDIVTLGYMSTAIENCNDPDYHPPCRRWVGNRGIFKPSGCCNACCERLGDLEIPGRPDDPDAPAWWYSERLHNRTAGIMGWLTHSHTLTCGVGVDSNGEQAYTDREGVWRGWPIADTEAGVHHLIEQTKRRLVEPSCPTCGSDKILDLERYCHDPDGFSPSRQATGFRNVTIEFIEDDPLGDSCCPASCFVEIRYTVDPHLGICDEGTSCTLEHVPGECACQHLCGDQPANIQTVTRRKYNAPQIANGKLLSTGEVCWFDADPAEIDETWQLNVESAEQVPVVVEELPVTYVDAWWNGECDNVSGDAPIFNLDLAQPELWANGYPCDHQVKVRRLFVPNPAFEDGGCVRPRQVRLISQHRCDPDFANGGLIWKAMNPHPDDPDWANWEEGDPLDCSCPYEVAEICYPNLTYWYSSPTRPDGSVNPCYSPPYGILNNPVTQHTPHTAQYYDPKCDPLAIKRDQDGQPILDDNNQTESIYDSSVACEPYTCEKPPTGDGEMPVELNLNGRWFTQGQWEDTVWYDPQNITPPGPDADSYVFEGDGFPPISASITIQNCNPCDTELFDPCKDIPEWIEHDLDPDGETYELNAFSITPGGVTLSRNDNWLLQCDTGIFAGTAPIPTPGTSYTSALIPARNFPYDFMNLTIERPCADINNDDPENCPLPMPSPAPIGFANGYTTWLPRGWEYDPDNFPAQDNPTFRTRDPEISYTETPAFVFAPGGCNPEDLDTLPSVDVPNGWCSPTTIQALCCELCPTPGYGNQVEINIRARSDMRNPRLVIWPKPPLAPECDDTEAWLERPSCAEWRPPFPIKKNHKIRLDSDGRIWLDCGFGFEPAGQLDDPYNRWSMPSFDACDCFVIMFLQDCDEKPAVVTVETVPTQIS